MLLRSRIADFAAGRRIALGTLHERPEDIALLDDIFVDPSVRDPRGKAQLVTRDIAAGLAELAAELESRGMDTERVARFLMRCVFSCFAEDVGLLHENLFRRTVETARKSGDHQRLSIALTLLWQTMDSGGMFGAEMLHRFNGHFFRQSKRCHSTRAMWIFSSAPPNTIGRE
ncbi:MAG: type IIL restriction-modification enzyme MmeI [Gemmatimonadaceae bacterium]